MTPRLRAFEARNTALATRLLDRIVAGDPDAANELARLAGISKLDALDAARSRAEHSVFKLANLPGISSPPQRAAASFGGIAAGGTVRHLGGFKKEVPQLRLTDAQLEKVGVIVSDAEIDPARKDLVELGPEAARKIVTFKIHALAKQLGFDPFAEAGEDGKSGPTRLRERLFAAIEKGQIDRLGSDFLRLNESGAAGFAAMLDRKTGQVVLAERDHPLPDGVARKIDPRRGIQVVKRMLGTVADPRSALSATKALAESFPLDALELLEKAHVKLNFGDQGAAASLTMKLALGEEIAEGLTKTDPHSRASYQKKTGEIIFGRRHAIDRDIAIATFARHEAGHALDHCLGQNGQDLSSEPEWQALFDKTRSGFDARQESPAFPTLYSSTGAHELFAEAVAIYLGKHCLVSSIGAETVTTRDHLERVNPEVYAFIEKVFTERVPQALASGRIQVPDQRPHRQFLAARIEAQASHPVDTGVDWIESAIDRTQLGLMQSSIPMLEAALEDLARARRSPEAKPIPMSQIQTFADDLTTQIRSHIRDLQGPA
jgi:hypothetical protein